MQQAPQDSVVFSGFLNHFKWNESGKSAFVFLSVSDQDANGNTTYKSVPLTVTSKLANMLSAKHDQIKQAKAQNQKMSVLIQVYSAKISSYAQPQADGSEGFPNPQITAFRARHISMDAQRQVLDDSENPMWAGQPSPAQQQYAPQPAQQQYAPQPAQQQYAPQPAQQQYAPQPAQQQYAPQPAQQQYAPQPSQQQYAPTNSTINPDDDDIPF